MTHSAAINKINQAYFKLERACEHTHDWDRYIQYVTDAERGHRRFKPAHVQCGLTAAQSIRLFAVKEVFERFVPAHSSEKIFTPEAKDFLHVRTDVFAACAIADKCQDTILSERNPRIGDGFTLEEMRDWLYSIDYAELNKDRRLKKAA